MPPSSLVQRLSQRLTREHPLVPLWLITTMFAGLVSGTLGLLFFITECGGYCSFHTAWENGSLVAGGTLPFLLLIGHYILLRPTKGRWSWLILAFPITPLTFLATILTPTIYNIYGLLFAWAAGALVGTSYVLAKGAGSSLGPILRKSSGAWVTGWLVFAIIGYVGRDGIWLSVGWLLCWAIVGWRSAGVLALVDRAALSQRSSTDISGHGDGPFHVIPTQKRVDVGCLLVDREEHLLLVKPVDQPEWRIPGGAVEAHESPLEGCVRTIRQSLQLDVSPGRLLCVEYERDSQAQPETLYFLFDGGFLSFNDIARIRLPRHTRSIYQLVSPAELRHYVSPPVERRLGQALQARQIKRTLYLEEKTDES